MKKTFSGFVTYRDKVAQGKVRALYPATDNPDQTGQDMKINEIVGNNEIK